MGKDVVVDGRVLYYQFHTGIGYDEIKLKNTDMVFRLAPRLRPVGTPGTKPVIVQGQLTRVSGQLVVNVTALRVMPDDAARLDQEVRVWLPGMWRAEKPGRHGPKSGARTTATGTGCCSSGPGPCGPEALRLEAAQTRGTVDAPSEWLALAEDARRRKVPAPEPEALVHRALQARLTAASKAADLDEIRSLVERYFPRAASDAEAGRLNLGQWEQAYSADPYATYRNPRLSADLRRALDRRLWADVMVKRFEIQAQTDPLSALNLASEAETELSDRPKFAEMLLNKGLEAARQNVGNLRRDEVRSMGQAYRDKLHNPQAELELYRGWLKIQRDRLSDTDADGPVEPGGAVSGVLTGSHHRPGVA